MIGHNLVPLSLRSYKNLDGGNPADAMTDFTSGVSEDIDLVGEMAAAGQPRRTLFKSLKKAFQRKALMSASIVATSETMEHIQPNGLVIGHA